MDSEACDVLIVGGGPGGSSCAWGLRDSGLDVQVLDKAVFPRDKVCAGWITPAVADLLELDLSDYEQDHVLQPITRFRTGVISGAVIQTEYSQTVSYGIRRCEFDDYFLVQLFRQLMISLRHVGTYGLFFYIVCLCWQM